VSLSPFPIPESALDPLELYASAIDSSDYVSRVAPQVRWLVPDIGKLLDVGAGGGQLGAALRDRERPWTAIEPSPVMRARLQRLHVPPTVVAASWEEARLARQSHDTVLAATMPAFFDHTERFLARCREWARRTVVWIVPAQAGPRGLVFAGCLPSDWHREDETPGIDLVRENLGASRPDEITFVDWTFSGVVQNLPRLAAYLADRLDWPPADERRPRLLAHLQSKARPDAAGLRLDIARKSAVLVWRVA
jgi:hypothetical protein